MNITDCGENTESHGPLRTPRSKGSMRSWIRASTADGLAVVSPATGAAGAGPSVGKISAKCCSFSAVSAPIFARKCAFCSIFQNH